VLQKEQFETAAEASYLRQMTSWSLSQQSYAGPTMLSVQQKSSEPKMERLLAR